MVRVRVKKEIPTPPPDTYTIEGLSYEQARALWVVLQHVGGSTDTTSRGCLCAVADALTKGLHMPDDDDAYFEAANMPVQGTIYFTRRVC